jgi:alpha-aminoadipic semialdehyde synthase
MIIGIRREDKNKWERRVPLIPDDIEFLKNKYGIKTLIQPSKIRAYSDEEYGNTGAVVTEDISKAHTIFAVKEIPLDFFEERKTYIFFSHTIKGQLYNMPLLQRMMELKCNLIDYERIVDETNRRLIFFGRHAGIAGMIETLHTLGQKLKLQGHRTPFEKIKQPYQYGSIAEAKNQLKLIGDQIRSEGIPDNLQPLVVGFAGYGNVSRGAQEVFDLLPVKSLQPSELFNKENFSLEEKEFTLYKVVFEEKDIAEPKKGTFELQDYYNNPQKYKGKFEEFIPHLSVLVNCIVWSEQYPRLITKNYLSSGSFLESDRKLMVIGDITCDINGSIEITYKGTTPGNASYTYFADDDKFTDTIRENGITVMAVDNLPCEIPIDSSREFSSALRDYVYEILNADFNKSFNDLSLPYPIMKGLILHQGELTGEYIYLNNYLNKE